MDPISYDEQQLIAIHNAGSRTKTLLNLKEMRKFISDEETDLKSITDSAIRHLEEMTDEEYGQFDLIPDFSN